MKILRNGLILGLIIVLIAFLNMGIIDLTVLIIICSLIAILAGIKVIIDNQRR